MINDILGHRMFQYISLSCLRETTLPCQAQAKELKFVIFWILWPRDRTARDCHCGGHRCPSCRGTMHRSDCRIRFASGLHQVCISFIQFRQVAVDSLSQLSHSNSWLSPRSMHCASSHSLRSLGRKKKHGVRGHSGTWNELNISKFYPNYV